MSNTSATSVLLERLKATNGFAVRESSENDVFWYTSSTPGPFYMNTENISGEQAAPATLAAITDLLRTDNSLEGKVSGVFQLINDLLNTDPLYNEAIEVLAEYYESHRTSDPTAISGGERRDWFFSIPIARKLGLPHLALFKSGEMFISDGDGKALDLSLEQCRVLHVADIINLASSYTDRWIPILAGYGVQLAETLSVAVRSEEGVNALAARGVAVTSPLIVNRALFKEAHRLGLISAFAWQEVELYYDSPKEWTRSYLSSLDPARDALPVTDRAKQERLAAFKHADPYGLKAEFPWYFQ